MNEKKLRLLSNGIASIADALDTSFSDVLEDMVDITLITREDASAIEAYMNSL